MFSCTALFSSVWVSLWIGKDCNPGRDWGQEEKGPTEDKMAGARGAGTLIPSAQRLVWAAKQALGKAALGALFA